MRKIYFKLIGISLALLVSVTVVIASSYAWLVLSGNPVATGIQVAVGGGNTILTAPNITYQAEDGKVYNYPGKFSDKLNFGQQSHYAYLKTLGNLTPVSTSNGVDWFIPAYYYPNDKEVQAGKAISGTLKDFKAFPVDRELKYANLDPSIPEEKEMIGEGSYIYLDFWVVSPGGDYYLRVSTGEETSAGGSFVMDLLNPVESGNGYVLAASDSSAAAAVRIGFLANDLNLVDDTMRYYQSSSGFDSRFTVLRGAYQEPDAGSYAPDGSHFTIYEPNGDYHPSNADYNGCYLETKPLGQVNGSTQEVRTRGNLTMQLNSVWAPAENGSGIALEQRFQTALLSKMSQALSEESVADLFYNAYLQGQFSSYVSKGQFAANTGALYAQMGEDGVIEKGQMSGVQAAGATDDIYIIKLERNVPQRIRMFIWLEGQDADCVDGVDSARFAVSIELAGGDTQFLDYGCVTERKQTRTAAESNEPACHCTFGIGSRLVSVYRNPGFKQWFCKSGRFYDVPGCDRKYGADHSGWCLASDEAGGY